MGSREDIKKEHEKAVIVESKEFFERHYGCQFDLEFPEDDPPDGVLVLQVKDSLSCKNNFPKWIEVADLYASNAWAKDCRSHANGYSNPTKVFSSKYDQESITNEALTLIYAKLSKENYPSIKNKYSGPGILLISINYPLITERNILKIIEAFKSRKEQLPIFESSPFLSIWIKLDDKLYLVKCQS